MPKDKEDLGTLDKRIFKTYQETLPEVMPLIDLEILQLWQTLIRQIAAKRTKDAIAFVNKTKNVFSVIPPQQRQKLLVFTEEFAR